MGRAVRKTSSLPADLVRGVEALPLGGVKRFDGGAGCIMLVIAQCASTCNLLTPIRLNQTPLMSGSDR